MIFKRQDVFLSDKKNLALRGSFKNSQLVFSMGDCKKLNGRPKLKEGKRSKKIDARFTEEEYQQIIELEQALGLSKTELVRMRILNNAGQTVVNSHELLQHIDGIGAELGRAGNNINQLAKHANILKLQGLLNPSVLIRFNDLLGDYIIIQQKLDTALRKVVRAIGH